MAWRIGVDIGGTFTDVALVKEAGGRFQLPAFYAGHSLGEYSALVAAGALSLSDGVRVVRARGTFMQEAVPSGEGAMAAILGLEPPRVKEACAEAREQEPGKVVDPANYNSPEQTVIAGHAAAVDRAIAICKAKGAKRALPLPVSAPFHCSLMAPVQPRLAEVLGNLLQRLQDGVVGELAHQRFLGALEPAARQLVVEEVLALVVQRLGGRPAAAPARLVEVRVTQDRGQPGRQVGARPVAPPGPQRPQIRLLHQLLGRLRGARQPQGDPVQLVGVTERLLLEQGAVVSLC